MLSCGTCKYEGKTLFISSRDGFTCCMESNCVLVCHQHLSHWPVVNSRPTVGVSVSSDFSFQMFSFSTNLNL